MGKYLSKLLTLGAHNSFKIVLSIRNSVFNMAIRYCIERKGSSSKFAVNS